ncbi:MAG: hypothetical protein U9P90_02345 [Patescibacteria group bacterium]|nr:hypothetical protein [Patescibacteria group bacterium]
MSTVTLGGISLPELAIENEFGRTAVDSSVEFALDTTPHVWEQSKLWKPLDLVGTSSTCMMYRSELVELKALADVVDATYTLVHNSITRTVRFRNEEPDVIEAIPLGPREGMTDTDIYTSIRIKLMEIN